MRHLRAAVAAGRQVDPRLSASLLGGTLATNLAMVLRALWFKLIIDAVLSGDRTAAMWWGVGLAVSEGVRSWSLLVAQMARMDLEARSAQHFHQRCMDLVASPTRIDHLQRQAVLNRVDALRSKLGPLGLSSAVVVDGVSTVVRAVVALVLLAVVHPALVLLPLFALPSLVAAHRAERDQQASNLAMAPALRRAEHLHLQLTQPGPGKEVRLMGAHRELVRREAEQWATATRIHVRGLRRSLIVNWLGWAVFYLALVGGILLVASDVAAGRAGAGDLFLAVVLATQVNTQVTAGAALVASLSGAVGALEDLDWLEREVAVGDVEAGAGATVPDRIRRGIALEGVGFRYEGATAPTLEGIDLTIPAGSVVAVVGPNGAGKSTFVKLVTGLHRPTEGRILVDGVDLGEVDARAWRERISVCFQDHVRFELALLEAVGIGDLPAVADRAAVTASLERAGADGLLAVLPEGLDTRLGVAFGGRDLSGGQWQKVAVARALMRRSPLLLVLDEPAATLDPDSEYRLFGRFADAAQQTSEEGGVTVLISHRFSTVRMADVIVVVDSGRVVESGTHHELLAADGVYAEMFRLQAAGYEL